MIKSCKLLFLLFAMLVTEFFYQKIDALSEGLAAVDYVLNIYLNPFGLSEKEIKNQVRKILNDLSVKGKKYPVIFCHAMKIDEKLRQKTTTILIEARLTKTNSWLVDYHSIKEITPFDYIAGGKRGHLKVCWSAYEKGDLSGEIIVD